MTTSQSENPKTRIKYVTWKDQDWVKFLMEFNRQYPDRNPLDEKFRLREQEFRTVQEAALSDRKRPIHPSVLERATRKLKQISEEIGSIYDIGATVSKQENPMQKTNITSATLAQKEAVSRAVTTSGKIRWKQEEWISIALALHNAYPGQHVLDQTSLEFITPEDVFQAQADLDSERRRPLESIAGAMEINRAKLLSVFPVARARTRGFAPRQQSLLPSMGVDQSTPAPAATPVAAVRNGLKALDAPVMRAPPAAAATPAAPSPQPAQAPAPVQAATAPVQAAPVAAAKSVDSLAAEKPAAHTTITPSHPASVTLQVTQAEMSAMAETVRPFFTMVFQEMARALAGMLPADFAKSLRDGLVSDVLLRMQVMNQNQAEQGTQPAASAQQPNHVAPSPAAVTALAGRKMADAPSTYGGEDAPQREVAAQAHSVDVDPLDLEINGNVAPPEASHDKVLDDIDRQVLQNPLAYLGKNDKIASVAVVGIKWKQQKDLQDAFPLIDFTCIQGDRDVQVASLNRCSKVIGINGSLKPQVDQMLAQVIPTKYSTVDGIEGVKRKLTKMISDGVFLKNRV